MLQIQNASFGDKKKKFYEDENVPSGSTEGGYKAFPLDPPLELNRFPVYLILCRLSKGCEYTYFRRPV